MWPSEFTGFLLGAGLVTALWEVVRCVRQGWASIANLRSLGVWSFWVGYHLSPLISYINGNLWDHFLLVPNLIDEGLAFSLLCMWGYMLGYEAGWHRCRRSTVGQATGIVLPHIRVGLLYGLILLSVVAFVVRVGGFTEVWSASYIRGAGQFDDRDALGRLKQMVNVGSTILFITTALAGSAAILRRGSGVEARFAGWVAIAAASLKGVHEFSRAAGYPLLILALLALVAGGRKRSSMIAASVLTAIALGTVGFYERGGRNPGIGNYASATFTQGTWESTNGPRMAQFTSDNPLDAMASWTRKVWTREAETNDWVVLVSRWLLSLNPVPSEVLKPPSIGPDLAVVMGTVGSVGLPTPAFGELYYVFGRWGALIMVPFGGLLAFFGRLPERSNTGLGLLCWSLAAMCFALGLHSGGRAMTRPLLYGVLLHAIVAWHRSHSRRLPKMPQLETGRWETT